VKQLVKARDWAATMKWLQVKHPDWTKKQLIEQQHRQLMAKCC
jgi:hypothetical protein